MAEEARILEHKNAIKIQSWFRGEKVRAYIRHLHHCALVIQRSYRAHVDRAIYREKVKIQTQWRGFFVRKYIFNYYARKRYLLALMERNEIVRKELDEIAIQRQDAIRKKKEETAKRFKEEEDRRHHYLISTSVRSGIYSSPVKKPHVTQRELELRQAKPFSKEERYALAKEKLERSLKSGFVDTSSTLERYTCMQSSPEPLPPIPSFKVQGPFRDPAAVATQRFKQLEPTLRVATSYTSVEESRAQLKAKEWTRTVVEDKFLPFTKQKEKYEPMLDSSRPFDRPEYGTKHFREEDRRKRITEKPFQRLVSPIPVFEKLGKTY
eukprot:gene13505-4385_t